MYGHNTSIVEAIKYVEMDEIIFAVGITNANLALLSFIYLIFSINDMKYRLFLVFFLAIMMSSAQTEINTTKVGVSVGDFFEFMMTEMEINGEVNTEGKYRLPNLPFQGLEVELNQVFNITVIELAEVEGEVFIFDFMSSVESEQYSTNLDVMGEFVIYNDWNYWVEKYNYEKEEFNTTYIAEASVDSDKFEYTYTTIGQSYNLSGNMEYDLNGVLKSIKVSTTTFETGESITAKIIQVYREETLGFLPWGMPFIVFLLPVMRKVKQYI
ncbi:MAG: hypothetical protein INQ03_25700 [Candidatus Heimdallarchaeota archaeon]|nr:hypothetical protein [Candidatus Heimdallarchaeota archaeon]